MECFENIEEYQKMSSSSNWMLLWVVCSYTSFTLAPFIFLSNMIVVIAYSKLTILCRKKVPNVLLAHQALLDTINSFLAFLTGAWMSKSISSSRNMKDLRNATVSQVLPLSTITSAVTTKTALTTTTTT